MTAHADRETATRQGTEECARTMDEMTTPLTPEQQAARLLGRRGGKASAAKLTPEQRKAKSDKAIKARWGKREAP
jgi:hypothetical protein